MSSFTAMTTAHHHHHRRQPNSNPPQSNAAGQHRILFSYFITTEIMPLLSIKSVFCSVSPILIADLLYPLIMIS